MYRRAALLVLLAFPCLSLYGQPPGQNRDERSKALLEGTHVFRRILHEADIAPLKSWDELVQAGPKRTLLVVLGDLDVLAQVPGGPADFLAKGGAVLVASDRAAT